MDQKKQKRTSKRAVISRLCSVWKELDGEPAFVLCRPDAMGVQGGCDAIVWRMGRARALEHTQVHTMNQRPGHLSRLKRFAAPIVVALRARFPHDFFHVNIPISGILRLSDPKAVAERMVEGVATILPTLREGRGQIMRDVPGIPFEWMVFLGVRTKREGKMFVGPYGPDDSLALGDMRRALKKKHAKAARYKAKGLGTVLLLDVPETSAIPTYFRQLFLEAAQQVPHEAYDDLVLAGTMWPPPFYHCLKRDGVLTQVGDSDSLFEATMRLEEII